MTISSFLAQKMTYYLGLSESKKDVLIYGLDIIFTTVIGYLCILFVSYLLNITSIVLPMLLIHSLLRAFSGGAHGSKFLYCISLSVIVFNGLGLVLAQLLQSGLLSLHGITVLNFTVFGIGFHIISRKAPIDVAEKPISCDKQREKLKVYSLATLLIWYGVVLMLILFSGLKYQVLLLSTGIGILWQVFTLTEWGKYFFALYGKALYKLGL